MFEAVLINISKRNRKKIRIIPITKKFFNRSTAKLNSYEKIWCETQGGIHRTLNFENVCNIHILRLFY